MNLISIEDYSPIDDLLVILIREFCLQSHTATEALRVSPLFQNWSSPRLEDSLFGAEFISDSYNFCGLNSFFYSSKQDTKRWLDVFEKATKSKRPTRFVCLVPTQHFSFPLLEIAKFALGCPLFQKGDSRPTIAGREMSLVLIANKESLLVDQSIGNLSRE